MRRPRGQQGFILIGVIFLVTLLIVAMAALAPRMGTQIKRDREEELIHRGKQYERAIQLYFRKFGRYPTTVEQLENTNNIRFLRKKYVDPITGKDEWKLVHAAELLPRKTPFFMGTGGTRPGGISPGGSAGGNSGIAGTGGNQGSSPGVNASDISKAIGGTSSNIGSGPFLGVASTSTKDGLHEFDGRTKYDEWQFVYDPRLDASRGGLNGGGIQPGVQPGGPQQGPGGINPPPPPPSPQTDSPR